MSEYPNRDKKNRRSHERSRLRLSYLNSSVSNKFNCLQEDSEQLMVIFLVTGAL
jgi:hypothetical protein